MKNQLLEVTPVVPESLSRLPELAANLFFGWHRPTRALFEDLDRELWKQSGGNPRLMLRCVSQRALSAAGSDAAYLQRYQVALQAFDEYLSAPPPAADAPLIAYFCAEYGFHESFPIYSGGLGILAGDHCKAASDERMNFVAVGLLYGQGYFTQSVDNDGMQHAEYVEHDPRDLPVEPARAADGSWVSISVPLGVRTVTARIWKAQVGRVAVYLLDTNCEQNAAADRDITHRLYGGDQSMRIRQEILLGIGGVRALRTLGLRPQVFHLNEGHAAFLILELLREHMKPGLSFPAALEAVASQCVFTTHTPVAAGHDAFGHDLIDTYLGEYVRTLDVPLEKVLELGRVPAVPSLFNMTHLALNGTRHINGVSRIHGMVSAGLCAAHWPEIRPEENPVGYITNGTHVPTFLHQTWSDLFDEALPGNWRDHLRDAEFWRAIERIPDEKYWMTAQSVKSQMIATVRERLQRQFKRGGLSEVHWRHVTRALDPAKPNVLTIGFARRFATYKRASLLLRDRERLARLVNDPQRPVLFLFAGKAHPADQPGQHVLREIKQLMITPQFMGRIVFLEDYDMRLARALVSGVDIWLNNPIWPLEASGTSGMKASANGRLNLSVLDGWWAEAWNQHNGWGIPPVSVQDPARRDALEAELIFDTIEEEAVPLYYGRRSDDRRKSDEASTDYSAEWVLRSKRAMSSVIPSFNTRRMVFDYSRGVYQPAARHYQKLASREYAGARLLAEWKQRVRQAWSKVAIRMLSEPPRDMPRGEQLRLRVAVDLNGLAASDVYVEFVARRVLPEANFEPPALCSYDDAPREGLWSAMLKATGELESDGHAVFALDAQPLQCGQFATEVRIFPWNELLTHPYELGLMKRL